VHRNLFILAIGLLSGLQGCNHFSRKPASPPCAESKSCCAAPAPTNVVAAGRKRAPNQKPEQQTLSIPSEPSAARSAVKEAGPLSPPAVRQSSVPPAVPIITQPKQLPEATESESFVYPSKEAETLRSAPPAGREQTKPQLPRLAPTPPTSSAPRFSETPAPVATTEANPPSQSGSAGSESVIQIATTQPHKDGNDSVWTIPAGAGAAPGTGAAARIPSETYAVASAPAKDASAAAGYSTLTGQVQQWRNTWRLRYAAIDAADPHGGSVMLVGGAELSRLREGQRVRVRGVLIPAQGRTGSSRYEISALEIIE
jgi:hypothetical protein